MPKADKDCIDPEQARYYRTYPKFPGVEMALRLLRTGKAKGLAIDVICMELRDHAAEHSAEFIAAFHAEPDAWTRLLLLAAIAEAASPDFIPLLTENLAAQEDLRYWAEFGLTKINNREARAAQWLWRSATSNDNKSE